MAKRKPAARATRRTTAKRTTAARASRTVRPKKASAAKKPAQPARKTVPRKPVKKAAPKKAVLKKPTSAKKAVKKAANRKPLPRKAAPKKVAPRKAAPKRAVLKKAVLQKAAVKKAAVKKTAPKPAVRKFAPARPVVRAAAPKVTSASPAKVRKVPALERVRKTIAEVEGEPSPPSSLDLNRTASSARSGRHEAAAHRREVTQVSPAITAGDVDADWEAAYTVGDEAPGGENTTPDQDVVDEIGQALGMEYADDEELGGEEKIAHRDEDRWELDPESSEDFEERD